MLRKWISGALVIGLCLASTGCTSFAQWWKNGAKVGPQYCRPHADIAPEWRESGSPELKTQSPADPCWWAQFNDPVLNDLIATLHRQNLTLKTAAMRICQARAVRGIAVGNLFPQQQSIDSAYARTGMSRNTQFGSAGFLDLFDSDWTVGAGMAWELDFWGRYRRLVESADDELDATIYNYDNAMVLLQAELAATYIQYRTLTERIRLAQHNIDLQRKTVKLVQERLDAGFVNELDLRQAKALLYTTEAAIPLLEIAHRKAENRICVLLGMPPTDMMDQVLGNSNKIPVPPPEVAIGIPAELLMQRPDVLAAERQLAAQCARIGVAEADLYPHISIVGQIGLQSRDYADLFDWDSTTSKIMPGLKWDVLNYGRLLNKVRVEDARFQESLWNYRNTVLLANEEAENALTEYLREQVRLRKLAQSVFETKKANDLAMLQYTEGVTDFQRVLDSQTGLVLRQDHEAQSRGLVAGYLVMVYKSLGGGWRCPCPGNPVSSTNAPLPHGELVPTPEAPTPVAPEPKVPGSAPTVPVLQTPPVPVHEPQETAPQKMPEPQKIQPAEPVGSQPALPELPVNPPTIQPTSPVLSVRPATAVFPIEPTSNNQAALIPTVPTSPSSVVPTSYESAPSATSPLPTTVRLPEVP